MLFPGFFQVTDIKKKKQKHIYATQVMEMLVCYATDEDSCWNPPTSDSNICDLNDHPNRLQSSEGTPSFTCPFLLKSINSDWINFITVFLSKSANSDWISFITMCCTYKCFRSKFWKNQKKENKKKGEIWVACVVDYSLLNPSGVWKQSERLMPKTSNLLLGKLVFFHLPSQ